MALGKLEIMVDNVKCNVEKKAVNSQVIQICNSELAGERTLLATKYWSEHLSDDISTCNVIGHHISDDDVEDVDFEPQTKACKMQDSDELKVVTHVVNTVLPRESIARIPSLAELAQVKRIATKFHLFKKLSDEDSSVVVPLHNGTIMNVNYQDIRYVESYLFRTQDRLTTAQRRFICHRVEPYFAGIERNVERLTTSERAIALFLLSFPRCSNQALVVFLNWKLHQLTSFTVELIRRKESMRALVHFYVDEYVDSVERKHISDIVATIAEYDTALSEKVHKRWKQQRDVLKKIEQKLLDSCVDVCSVSPKTVDERETKFYRETLHDISAVDVALIPNFTTRELYTTLCSPVHLVQLRETAYSFTTPTLKMEIQRRVDFLTLIIMEHNMRAQSRRLWFDRNLYNLAQENTILAYELLDVQLQYVSHASTSGRKTIVQPKTVTATSSKS